MSKFRIWRIDVKVIHDRVTKRIDVSFLRYDRSWRGPYNNVTPTSLRRAQRAQLALMLSPEVERSEERTAI